MLQRDIVGLPTSIYPPDPWALVEKEFTPRYLAETESIFAIGNGFIGMRAVPEEGRPYVERGSLINGLHEQWPIRHPEHAFGFAEVGQTIIAAPDPRRFHLYVDDEPLDLRHGDIREYERRLDFRTGLLTRGIEWRLPTGVRVRVTSASMTSLVQRHLVASRYEVEVLDGHAHVVVSSQLRNVQDTKHDDGDPRRAKGFDHQVLVGEGARAHDRRAVLQYRVAHSGMTMACGIDHVLEGDAVVHEESSADDQLGRLVVTADMTSGQRMAITKFAAFHTSAVNHDGQPTRSQRLADRVDRTLDRAMRTGWQATAEEQRQYLEDFWDAADVEVHGNPTVCQAIRWSLFQVCQATARADSRGIPAKGLTGSAYEGHYFWDAEIYVLPFLTYTNPLLARNALRFRHGMLDHARRRAREVNQKGALFPWRTITGEEASAFFEAGTAQYHINADISHAVSKYAKLTGDEDFLAESGSEILVETARLWADLGFFRTEGDRETFHIHGVTGPDEYTTVVDDNAYTNMMAAGNLRDAVDVVEWLREQRPEDFARLLRRTNLHSREVAEWGRAAESMYVPYDGEHGITPQDAHFLDLQRWDFDNVPRDKYPLLLHFHPLVIYRYQVIKQADVVLAMFLHDQAFDMAHQERNFDYYDPLTTGDSSLSTAIQSIVAARIGNEAKAIEYFRYGVFMDLANVAGNTGDGVHIAAAGGVWLSIVHGFGGLTDTGEMPDFRPRLPASWDGLTFNLRLRGRKLRVDVSRHETTYTVRGEDALAICHQGEPVVLQPDVPTVMELHPMLTSHPQED